MSEQNGQWVTIKGTHVFIKDGESAEEALNRTIAEKNEKTKQEQIAKNKVKADTLNNKKSPDVAKLQKLMQDTNTKFAESYTSLDKVLQDKSASTADKKDALRAFKKLVFNNTSVWESSGEGHVLNIADNGRVWYENKSGTMFMLDGKRHWQKFTTNGVVDDGKISEDGFERVKALLDRWQNEKG